MDFFNEQVSADFKEEIEIICQKFNIKEMVIVGENANGQTVCFQHTPDRRNQVFNTIYETLNLTLMEIAKKGNHSFKRF